MIVIYGGIYISSHTAPKGTQVTSAAIVPLKSFIRLANVTAKRDSGETVVSRIILQPGLVIDVTPPPMNSRMFEVVLQENAEGLDSIFVGPVGGPVSPLYVTGQYPQRKIQGGWLQGGSAYLGVLVRFKKGADQVTCMVTVSMQKLSNGLLTDCID